MNTNLSEFAKYIPFLVPVVIIELVLMIAALADLIRREHTRGPKWLWFVVVILFEIIGPIVYFVAGRQEE